MKTGIVDVGGGMRGVYTCGIYDRLTDLSIDFDVAIGVSAGSANQSSYLSHQRGRAYRFYREYSFRKEYMSVGNFLRTGSLFGMDYIYETLAGSEGEDPLDYDNIEASRTDFYVVAANARTGETKYFCRTDMSRDRYDIMKASCSIPMVCKPCVIEGEPYFDGAICDPVPIEKAFELGCDRVVLLLTKPRDTVRSSAGDVRLAKMIKRKYPRAAELLCGRAEKYNRSVELARQYEREGRLLIVAPDDTCGVDTLKKSREALDCLYQKGYEDASAIEDFLKRD